MDKRLKQRLCSDWIKVPAFCAVSLFLKLQSLLGKRRTSQVCTVKKQVVPSFYFNCVWCYS